MAFFNVSLDTANALYTWGWRLSLGGAVVTAIGVCLLMWGTRVRDHNFEGQIAKLHESAAASEERAATMELKAKQIQLALEKERLARVKIESRIAPRSNFLQQHELTARLSEFKNQHVALIASPSTPESEMFARHLGAPLSAAGWQTEILPGTAEATVLFPTGVIVYYAQHPTDAKIAATRLVEALKEMGIDATASPGWPDDQAPYTIKVVISTK